MVPLPYRIRSGRRAPVSPRSSSVFDGRDRESIELVAHYFMQNAFVARFPSVAIDNTRPEAACGQDVSPIAGFKVERPSAYGDALPQPTCHSSCSRNRLPASIGSCRKYHKVTFAATSRSCSASFSATSRSNLCRSCARVSRCVTSATVTAVRTLTPAFTVTCDSSMASHAMSVVDPQSPLPEVEIQ